MDSPTKHDPHEKAAEHLEILRGYARKALVDGVPLSRLERVDKSVRLNEFVTFGHSFKLTVKEMVTLILKEACHKPSQCGCHACISRETRA